MGPGGARGRSGRPRRPSGRDTNGSIVDQRPAAPRSGARTEAGEPPASSRSPDSRRSWIGSGSEPPSRAASDGFPATRARPSGMAAERAGTAPGAPRCSRNGRRTAAITVARFVRFTGGRVPPTTASSRRALMVAGIAHGRSWRLDPLRRQPVSRCLMEKRSGIACSRPRSTSSGSAAACWRPCSTPRTTISPARPSRAARGSARSTPPPASPARVTSRSARSPAAAATPGSTRSAPPTGGRSGCPGPTPG